MHLIKRLFLCLCQKKEIEKRKADAILVFVQDVRKLVRKIKTVVTNVILKK